MCKKTVLQILILFAFVVTTVACSPKEQREKIGSADHPIAKAIQQIEKSSAIQYTVSREMDFEGEKNAIKSQRLMIKAPYQEYNYLFRQNLLDGSTLSIETYLAEEKESLLIGRKLEATSDSPHEKWEISKESKTELELVLTQKRDYVNTYLELFQSNQDSFLPVGQEILMDHTDKQISAIRYEGVFTSASAAAIMDEYMDDRMLDIEPNYYNTMPLYKFSLTSGDLPVTLWLAEQNDQPLRFDLDLTESMQEADQKIPAFANAATRYFLSVTIDKLGMDTTLSLPEDLATALE